MIHPAVNFFAHPYSVGILDPAGRFSLITENRKRIELKDCNGQLSMKPLPHPDLYGRWPETQLEKFLAGEGPGTIADAGEMIFGELLSRFEFQDVREPVLGSFWILGTYLYQLFQAFPRLNIHGEFDSGKTKLEISVASTAFNGLFRIDPTPATIFRLITAWRPTLCLDEMENLSDDHRQEIQGIIRSGYKTGARIDRMEGRGELRLRTYDVYSPMVLASIKGLHRVTESRSISIMMRRAKAPEKLNAEVNPYDKSFALIRDACYRIALMRCIEIAASYTGMEVPSWLTGRNRELWLPLLALARVGKAKDVFFKPLLDLAAERTKDRVSLSIEAEAILKILEARLGTAHEIIIRPRDICSDLAVELQVKVIRAETVGHLLQRLGFQKAGRDRQGVLYRVRLDEVEDFYSRYDVSQP